MKVLVCGGRKYTDDATFNKVMGALKNVTHVIHGGASGADTMAKRWARRNLVKQSIYNADWEKLGQSAGPIRNTLMLDKNPDVSLVIAFPGGKGTENMISLAESSGFTILIVT